MRSTSALYRYACEEEGCVSHSDLVKLFHGIDVALQPQAPAKVAGADNADPQRESDSDADICPAPPALTDALLIAFQPSLRYPTHISLSSTHLGDAGAAAFFRVLPMLRWLRTIEACNVGAGRRTLAALSHALTAYLVDGCEDGCAAVPTQVADEPTDDAAPSPSPLPSSNATAAAAVDGREHFLMGRLPALEYVDLRHNEAVFTLSAEALLAALRRRRAVLIRWCVAQGERDPEAAVLAALEVHVDADNLLPLTAQALAAWNADAAAVKAQRQRANAERTWQSQLRVFTAEDGESQDGWRPTGERVLFRLPLEPDNTISAEVTSANEIRTCINTHMQSFLLASSLLGPIVEAQPDAVDTKLARPAATAHGARAALQACVDFGADTLDALRFSNAAVWHAISHTPSASSDNHTAPITDHETLAGVGARYAEAQANVAALLHSLDSLPALEKELTTSEAVGGVVLERHLRRLRELYTSTTSRTHSSALSASSAGNVSAVGEEEEDAPPSEGQWREMIILYYRVVAALVTTHFSGSHMPSLQGCEEPIARVAQYVVDHLVVGAHNAETLTRLLERVRQTGALTLPSASASDEDTPVIAPAPTLAATTETTRALPPLMASCYYQVHHSSGTEAQWVRTYADPSAGDLHSSSGSSSSGGVNSIESVATSCSLADEIPECLQAFHRCRCPARVPAANDVEKKRKEPLSFSVPCESCCYYALKSVEDALQDPLARTVLCARWSLLRPARDSLPRELRVFFIDMMVRQRSRAAGGCAYVPPLESLSGRRGDSSLVERWSMPAWLACTRHQDDHWVAVLRAFAQWYRLRVVEVGEVAQAQQIFRFAAK